MNYKRPLWGLVFISITLLIACSRDDAPSPNPPPGTPESLPSWEIEPYVYLEDGSYGLFLHGVLDDQTSESKGIIYSTHSDPRLESNIELDTISVDLSERINDEFTARTAGLAPNTTYHLRGYRKFGSYTLYTEVVSFSTGPEGDFCGVTRYNQETLPNGNWSSNSTYHYDSQGRIIMKQSTITTNTHYRYPPFVETKVRLFRYRGELVIRTLIEYGMETRVDFEGLFNGGSPTSASITLNSIYTRKEENTSYAFTYPDDESIVYKFKYEDVLVDSIYYHVDQNGNIDWKQRFWWNEDHWELDSEARYYYNEWKNPYKGNMDVVGSQLYFNENFMIGQDYRRLPQTDFTRHDVPASITGPGQISFTSNSLQKAIIFKACD